MTQTGEKPTGFAAWVIAIRAPFFTGSIVPAVFGVALAYYATGVVHWLDAALTVIAIMAIHGGANMLNDYFDHLTETDEANVEYVRPFTGGSRVIQEGILSVRAILTASLGLIAVGCAIGVYFVVSMGWPILVIGAVGVFLAYFYTGFPLRLVARGLGEAAIFLDFGVLAVLGAWFVQTRVLAWEAALAGVPVALLITAILFINEFQDAESDAKTGKRHLVVRLGKKHASVVYAAGMLSVYAIIGALVILDILPAWALLGLLPLPIVLKGINVALKHYETRFELAPANRATIVAHLSTGLLMTVGLVLARLV
jgi:1,4-dihydroxy-2-naphthoate octaprenyltransferase